MTHVIRTSLAILFLMTAARADEAIEPTGKKHRGELIQEKGTWIFRTASKTDLPLEQLAHVRFDAKAVPLPHAPVHAVLMLPHDERVSGTLLKVDAKEIVFALWSGKTHVFARSQVTAIEHAGESIPVLRDEFESTLEPWQSTGNLQRSQERAFFGKSALLLDAAGAKSTRTWTPAVGDGAIRLFFQEAEETRWSANLPGDDVRLSFRSDKAGYGCSGSKEAFGRVARTTGWHLLSIEATSTHVRVFVDDRCLGQSPLSAKSALSGIRLEVAEGKLWIDEVSVTRRVPPMKRPASVADQDSVWLEHGEQLFGTIVAADAGGVTLDAKFGKRAFAWSKLRGIIFAQSKEPPRSAGSEITFRPAPGFPLDRLYAKLLRWEKGSLIVEHGLLGEFAIERDRLHMVRALAK